jgi:NifU-like protein
MPAVYPDKIWQRILVLNETRDGFVVNATGLAAAFECGTSIRFDLAIEAETKLIESAAIHSNGCGYMHAAAAVLVESIKGRHLTDLHGSRADDLLEEIFSRLDAFPGGRRHCAETAIEAFRWALADFRRRQVEEFAGETALICTCFGVSEETVEAAVNMGATTVSKVGGQTRAGTGCGSCQMLIQEIIDSRSL